MSKKEKLKGKKIAIVALGGTFYDYILSRTRSEKYDEVWAINGMGEIIKHDRVFMMDPPERFLDDIKAGTQTGIVSEMLKTHEGPIYSCTLDKRCPGVVEYPLEFVVQKTGLAYLNNTVAYALAFAVAHEVKSLHLFGLDFSYADRPHFAESGRACCEFWVATAISKGIQIEIAHNSPFLDTNVADEEKLYGYHRLKDPLVLAKNEKGIEIGRQSKLTPPEPLDGKQHCHVWGRDDIEGVTYEKKNPQGEKNV
tara:strand:+ start:4210 stop:4968 length:759 start_codon:yes stop_codon:yes gene_type:complete